MRITAWRITQRRFLKTAFTGEGARLYGGRWNSKGTAMVYLAESQSLAVLEMLVHLDASALLAAYVLTEVRFEVSLVMDLEPSALPKRWGATPAPQRLKAIGDNWIASRASAILRVPSALVPGESNYLINPSHPDFKKIAIGKPIRYEYDQRFAASR